MRQKTGGRKRGAPNKRTLVAHSVLDGLTKRFRRAGVLKRGETCDPIERLVALALGDQLDAGQRFNVWSALLPYLYPRRSAVALQDDGEPTECNVTLHFVSPGEAAAENKEVVLK